MSRSQDPLFDERPSLDLEFGGEVIFWKGPSPFHFISVPEPEAEEIAAVASLVSYGWGVIPVTARIGETTWTTSLFPRQGGYLVPVRDSVRKAERIELGDHVAVSLAIVIDEWSPPDR
jgi:Domain of unknown function (DUF1905)